MNVAGQRCYVSYRNGAQKTEETPIKFKCKKIKIVQTETLEIIFPCVDRMTARLKFSNPPSFLY
jgi:hypothetical protein